MFKAGFVLRVSQELYRRSLEASRDTVLFPSDTLQQTDLKPCLAAENTSVLIILASTVYKCSETP